MLKMVMDVPKKMMEPKMPELRWCHFSCPEFMDGNAETLASSLLMLLADGNVGFCTVIVNSVVLAVV